MRLEKLALLSLISVIALTSCQETPTASFIASNTTPDVDETVLFTNTSDDASSYEWTFGDGITSTMENPFHTFSVAGSYMVELTAFSKNGNKSDKATVVITVSGGSGGSNLVPTSGSSTLTTCNATIYDSGGSANDYEDNSDGYLILMPATSGQKIRISGWLKSEEDYDYLMIYNGSGVSGTPIWSESGNVTVPTLTSTASNGALTIRFESDGSYVDEGFQLQASCVAK